MAGNWNGIQNKVRPGAYIDFRGIPKPISTIGSRGIATMLLPMSWGKSGEIIEILSEDLYNGRSLEKIGYTAFDDESQAFRECLKHAYKLLAYRADTGGTEATATLGDLEVEALYPGIVGNKIKIVINANEKEPTKYDVITLVDNIKKDLQTVSTSQELKTNAWVTFTGTTFVLVENVGTNLTGGTDGTVEDTIHPLYLNEITKYNWNTMGIIVDSLTIGAQYKQYIEDRRNNKGRYCQIVLKDYNMADFEGVISTSQGYEVWNGDNLVETVPPLHFVATVTGMTAAAGPNQSRTGFVIEGATKIIGDLIDDDIITALGEGKFIISRRQDGIIKVEKDINTFVSFEPTKGYDYSKNRIIRTLDEVGNTTQLTWEKSYMGKIDNNQKGRDVYKAELVSYSKQLEAISCIQNFEPDQLKVYEGFEADSVVVEWTLDVVDSAEKLYMTVYTK